MILSGIINKFFCNFIGFLHHLTGYFIFIGILQDEMRFLRDSLGFEYNLMIFIRILEGFLGIWKDLNIFWRYSLGFFGMTGFLRDSWEILLDFKGFKYFYYMTFQVNWLIKLNKIHNFMIITNTFCQKSLKMGYNSRKILRNCSKNFNKTVKYLWKW